MLGIIPARGGSKAIPRKNLAPLAGRPLLAYTAEAALASRHLTRVVVSTDDPDIIEASRVLGLEVPFVRPSHLAADEAPMLPVLQHAVTELSRDGFSTDAVVLLQPTSPFRRAEHIDRAIETLESTEANSVVSVVEVPHQYSPTSLMRLVEGRLRPYLDGPTATRRQDKPVFYARNGPAVLVVRISVLAAGSLYGDDCRPMFMSAADSLDIDQPHDLMLANLMLSRS